MTAIILAPEHNAQGKRDAQEFQREAAAFARAHGGVVSLFDNDRPLPARRFDVARRIRACAPGSIDTLALFCHGWPTGVQAGFRVEHVASLAAELRAVSAPSLVVALYCCSTGADTDADQADEIAAPGPGGDGGFADRLRDAVCDLGIAASVFAHSTAGHTTRNPRVRVFRAGERAGGYWLIEPGSELWPVWLRMLHSTDLRFRFPFMSQSELEQELRGQVA